MKVLCGCKIFAWKIRLCFDKSFMIIKKPLLAENVLDQRKTLACRKIFACGKRIWWSESLSLWETSLMKEKPWLVETFLDERICGNLPRWTEYLCLRKMFLMKEKSWLVEENFLDKGKFFVCGKLIWWGKNFGLLKASLTNGISLLGENFLDQGKILACRKLRWWRESLCLWKTSLMKESSWLVITSLMKKNSLLVQNLLDEIKILACWKVLL